MTITKPIELRFEVNGITLAAQEWGDPNGEPVLALHGWLDNSASFYRLAPLLTNVRLIAVDMAGHGESDHRVGFSSYLIWNDVSDIYAIANQLDWDNFSLLGHSRGAIVSSLFASTFPDKIDKLMLLDGLFPEPIKSEDVPKQLAQAVLDNAKENTPTIYENLKQMSKARQNSRWPLSRQSADAIIGRGVRKVAGGYCWSSDPKLMAASSFKLTRKQINVFLSSIQAPTKLLLAKEGLPKEFPSISSVLDHFSFADVEMLEGNHHFHMDSQVDLIAELFNHFLQT
jgi:pimeloyl-ACP methyl ester carboxylesterase